MTSQIFNTLTPQPDIVSILGINSPIILTWPHNGTYVPEELHDKNGNPLGLPAEFFDINSPHRRHEVADWGMDALLKTVLAQEKNKGKNIRHIVSNYSRLVADNNRIESVAITKSSDDTGKKIPLNQDLSETEKEERLKTYHRPYHQAIDKAVQEAKQKFDYAVVIDMHSFTRTFQGIDRDVCIGTIKPNATELSNIIERELANSTLGKFKPNTPYDIERKAGNLNKYTLRNSGHDIAQRNDIEYIGIEICNDLLTAPESRETIAQLVLEAAYTAKAELNPAISNDNQHNQENTLSIPTATWNG